jgi:hypothetical protein
MHSIGITTATKSVAKKHESFEDAIAKYCPTRELRTRWATMHGAMSTAKAFTGGNEFLICTDATGKCESRDHEF